jgi:hypothetical protein
VSGLLLAIALGVIALAALTLAAAAAVVRLDGWWTRRRRARHGLTEEEALDALAPFGADISVWPSRAPRNGSAHEDVA